MALHGRALIGIATAGLAGIAAAGLAIVSSSDSRAAQPVSRGIYSGTTTQGGDIVVEANRARTRITIRAQIACAEKHEDDTPGAEPFVRINVAEIPGTALTRTGSFSRRYRNEASEGGDDPTSFVTEATVTGRFTSAKRVTGTLKVKFTSLNEAGLVSDTCSPPFDVGFEATRVRR